MKKRMMKHSIGAISLGYLLFNLVSCSSNQAEDVRQPYVVPDSLFRTLVIDTVKTSQITDAIKFNGMVDFNTDKVVSVFPLISGNLQDVSVMPGDYVHAGQVLGMVKSPEVANYNAALVTAEANVRLNAKLLDQQKDLFKSGLASQIDITNAEVAYEQAVAARVAAEKILSINGNNKNGEYQIKSPIEGFMVQKNVTNGMAIRTDNGGALFTISDLKNVWIQANVYEENIGRVHEGDMVDVTTISYPDKVFKGKVDKLMNVLDPTSKVMKMRVVLDNPGYLLKPQMFATVTSYNKENKQAVSISRKDLVFDHSQYYVIVITGKKEVQIRPVEIIGMNGETAYIKAGVNPGERLIGSEAILIYGSLNS
ncbi:MAG TPA: efflux RND transporter periplasmic adaptor subunit [Mucilaginibacter sp.]|jgi:cobalt-zinc-cadmium efflux system membrane fusion protein|nr:efflux RND transporter periplasmic adaptor subunit [Mucilaginibacter sp.]